MILNKWIIQGFSFNVTTRYRKVWSFVDRVPYFWGIASFIQKEFSSNKSCKKYFPKELSKIIVVQFSHSKVSVTIVP